MAAIIWGTADALYFFRQWWTADATATVRVQSLEHTHRWAKLGLMFRESAVPGGPPRDDGSCRPAPGWRCSIGRSPAALEQRDADTGNRARVLRLRRAGNTFTGYSSADGITWRTVGSVTLPLDLDTFVGVAITSHDSSTRASGVFDNLSVIR